MRTPKIIFSLCIIGMVSLSSHALAQCEVYNNAEAANPLYAASPAPQNITGLQFVDIDHDGDQDCYLVENQSSAMILYRNVGTAQRPKFVRTDSTGFENAPVYPGGGAWAFADVDGDGKDEFLIGGSESGDRKTYHFITIYKNQGTLLNPDYYDTGGRFLGIYNSSDFTRGFLQFVFEDVDGDGDKDFQYVSTPGDFTIKNDIYLNAGSDTSPAWQLYQNVAYEQADLLGMRYRTYYDFDNDGLPDCLHTDGVSQYAFYHNVGSQQAPSFYWDLTDILPAFDGVSAYLVTDLNADGAPDVFNYKGQFATVVPVPVIVKSIVAVKNRSVVKLSSATTTEGYHYGWEYNGQKVSGYNKPFIYALKKGNYVLTIRNTCGEGVSLPYLVSSDTMAANADKWGDNLLSLETPAAVKLYPNPFTESVVLQLSQTVADTKSTVVITDLAGRQLLSQTVSGKTVRIGSNLSKGIYVLQVWQNGKLIYHDKLLKQ